MAVCLTGCGHVGAWLHSAHPSVRQGALFQHQFQGAGPEGGEGRLEYKQQGGHVLLCSCQASLSIASLCAVQHVLADSLRARLHSLLLEQAHCQMSRLCLALPLPPPHDAQPQAFASCALFTACFLPGFSAFSNTVSMHQHGETCRRQSSPVGWSAGLLHEALLKR